MIIIIIIIVILEYILLMTSTIPMKKFSSVTTILQKCSTHIYFRVYILCELVERVKFCWSGISLLQLKSRPSKQEYIFCFYHSFAILLARIIVLVYDYYLLSIYTYIYEYKCMYIYLCVFVLMMKFSLDTSFNGFCERYYIYI